MVKPYKKVIFLFRRDLRIEDNKGLSAAFSNARTVIPLFIIDPRQVDSSNPYRSLPAMQFLFTSLEELNEAFKKHDNALTILHGEAEAVISHLLDQEPTVDALFCNYDYTPFSRIRDEQIAAVCKKRGVAFVQYHDALLNPPGSVLNTSNNPYTIFTPFYKKASTYPVAQPEQSHLSHAKISSHALALHTIERLLMPHQNRLLAIKGGRTEGLTLLKRAVKKDDYAQAHDHVALETTHLSAHLKFGTLGIREVYHTLADHMHRHKALIRQLYWRDFFTTIAFHFPHVFGNAFREKYNHIVWSYNQKQFEQWCSGTTGFPIVDAGMRQLNETGYMHNRVRMITASFLIKDLHIDWQWGERYFAQKLVDYDPAVNNGNWQWVASTGCDAQPSYRIFNPWLQQKKFDSECMYIKRWVPELKEYDPKIIHAWYAQRSSRYPQPIVNHAHEIQRTKKMYNRS